MLGQVVPSVCTSQIKTERNLSRPALVCNQASVTRVGVQDACAQICECHSPAPFLLSSLEEGLHCHTVGCTGGKGIMDMCGSEVLRL